MANTPFGKFGFHKYQQLLANTLPPVSIQNKQLRDFGGKKRITHRFAYLTAAETHELILIGGNANHFFCVGFEGFLYRGKGIAAFAVEQVVEFFQFTRVCASRGPYLFHIPLAFWRLMQAAPAFLSHSHLTH